jgi:uncharacterized damage-inducible protein DinB
MPSFRPVSLALVLSVAAPLGAHAQAPAPADSMAESVRELWRPIRRYVLAAANAMPDSLYGYRPASDIRSFGQLIGHVTNTHYNFCAAALEETRPTTPNHEQLATKAELVAALERSLAYCDRAYDALTTQSAAQVVPIFGTRRARQYPLVYNIAHDNEHYGNMVTYMRINGLVPPSSQRPAARQ